jgi:hypothetical protein
MSTVLQASVDKTGQEATCIASFSGQDLEAYVESLAFYFIRCESFNVKVGFLDRNRPGICVCAWCRTQKTLTTI